MNTDEVKQNITNSFINHINILNTISNQFVKNNHLQNIIHVPILYINLERCKGRKEFMEKQFKKFDITSYERIVAVNGNELNSIESGGANGVKFINDYRWKGGYFPKTSEIGAVLSHLKAIKTAYDKNYESAIIMEDDCDISLIPFWYEKSLKNIIHGAPSNWKIIQLCSESVDYYKDEYKNYLKKYFFRDGNFSATCYIINRDGMKDVLKNVSTNSEKFKYNFHLKEFGKDNSWVADSLIFKATDTFCICPPLFFPYNIGLSSTIHSEHDVIHYYTALKIIGHYFKFDN